MSADDRNSYPPSRDGASLFCFGLGYTTTTLAEDRLKAGWTVAGTRRTAARCSQCADSGLACFPYDGGAPDPDMLSALVQSSHIVISLPPDPDGDPIARKFGPVIARAKRLRWLGYLSSTGVYGNHDGAWVDETTPPRPSDGRGRRRCLAEAQWRALMDADGVPIHIFRIAGIYGPGRSAFDQIAAGSARRVIKPGHAFSRIHRDDIVAALVASMGRPAPGLVVNLADDEPAESAAVVEEACRLIDAPPPPAIPFAEAEAEMSDMARSFWADNRRIANRRLHALLGKPLIHPSYREGLRAILGAGDHGKSASRVR